MSGLLVDPPSSWMPVPLGFPFGPWLTAGDWVRDASAAAVGTGDRPALAAALSQLQESSPPLDGAQARFLWTLDVQQPLLAHVYAAENAADVQSLQELATAGLGGFVQTLREVNADAYERAVLAVVILEPGPEGATPVAMRWIGEQQGMLLVLDLLSEQTGALALAMDDAEELFAGIRVTPEQPQ